MNVLLGRKSEKERTLMPVFEEHNKRIYSLLHTEYSPGTPQDTLQVIPQDTPQDS